ncbi:RpiB/LacA/LacB family sugar-phosphate isomerase [Candidatus Shapirobacteria bacterium]|nr:RpiB/LacA/LacB family sugar-phosphate isomerase [Candidatus Shapirobacteria bacterium]
MIYLGSDHRGYQLKEKIKEWLTGWGYEYEDLGNERYEPEDDYPEFATKVAKGVLRELGDLGILICGSGIGISIVANRFAGVRCGLGFSEEQIRRGRKEDDINCLALPADFVNDDEARQIVRAFLETKFLGEEKYKRRIREITNINE